jgi:hypothetical protein
MDAEPVQESTGIKVPEADCKVNPSANQVTLVIAGVAVVGVDKAVHSTGMACQDLVRWPV